MNYREFLYSTYVSASKCYVYQNINARARDKNIRNTLWSLHDWLPDKETAPRVLDLGCGAGNMLAVFERVGYTDFVGVDNSAEQMEIARRMFSNVVQADVFEYLKCDNLGEFDLIVAFDIIEHLTRDEAIQFLQLIHQHLKPDGSLILQMPNGDTPFVGSVFWSDLTHETLFTVVSLRHLLEACGFANCQFQERGPVPRSIVGISRVILWHIIRLAIKTIHYIETGTPSTNIYTRVFICRATKRQEE